MQYRSTKKYGHDLGLSACYRQHRATSHCRFLHGYPLAFEFEFGADQLDERNWVVDFGSLKALRNQLCEFFDHKLLIATDDPARYQLEQLGKHGLADTLVVGAVGCEAFAHMAYSFAAYAIRDCPHATVISARVWEHSANSAIYINPNLANRMR